MPKHAPGKNHSNRRPRGSIKARLARENPFQYALLYHDHQLAQEMRERRIQEAAMWRGIDACCLTCHAPLIHTVGGIFYCPYERAGMDQRARQIIAGSCAGELDGGEASSPPTCPPPSMYLTPKQAAARLGVSRSMISWLLKRNRWKYYRVGKRYFIDFDERERAQESA